MLAVWLSGKFVLKYECDDQVEFTRLIKLPTLSLVGT